jgi:hypothetical protein
MSSPLALFLAAKEALVEKLIGLEPVNGVIRGSEVESDMVSNYIVS